jgi:uncharacterized membrane protein (DUF373 family)
MDLAAGDAALREWPTRDHEWRPTGDIATRVTSLPASVGFMPSRAANPRPLRADQLACQMDKAGSVINDLVVRPRGAAREREAPSWIAVALGYCEFVLNTVVAFALGIGGIILLGVVMYDFLHGLGRGPFIGRVLLLLGGLLLVFIFTELISTLRVVIATREVKVEPFLIVGIVAAVRRVIVISAEAKSLVGTPRFRDTMLEIAVLSGTILVLGVTVFVLRITRGGDGGPNPDAGK